MKKGTEKTSLKEKEYEMKNISVKTIKASKRSVFRYWLEFLKPFHKLASKEMETLSILLYYRYELTKEVNNPDLVDKLLFSTSTRNQVKIDLGGMQNGVFNNMLTTLRKKKVIKNNRINPSLIPKIGPKDNEFNLIFNFEIDDNK